MDIQKEQGRVYFRIRFMDLTGNYAKVCNSLTIPGSGAVTQTGDQLCYNLKHWLGAIVRIFSNY